MTVSLVLMLLSIAGLVLILVGRFTVSRIPLLAGAVCELIVCVGLLLVDK